MWRIAWKHNVTLPLALSIILSCPWGDRALRSCMGSLASTNSHLETFAAFFVGGLEMHVLFLMLDQWSQVKPSLCIIILRAARYIHVKKYSLDEPSYHPSISNFFFFFNTFPILFTILLAKKHHPAHRLLKVWWQPGSHHWFSSLINSCFHCKQALVLYSIRKYKTGYVQGALLCTDINPWIYIALSHNRILQIYLTIPAAQDENLINENQFIAQLPCNLFFSISDATTVCLYKSVILIPRSCWVEETTEFLLYRCYRMSWQLWFPALQVQEVTLIPLFLHRECFSFLSGGGRRALRRIIS